MQKVWTNCDMSTYCIWGGPPPHDSAIIFWHIAVCSHFLHTFWLLLKLFWTFPLKFIGFLRWEADFPLVFQCYRWLFCLFSGHFAATWRKCFRTKGWAPYFRNGLNRTGWTPELNRIELVLLILLNELVWTRLVFVFERYGVNWTGFAPILVHELH